MRDYPVERVNEKELKDSVLCVTVDGRQYELAKCRAILEVYEKEQQIPLSSKGIYYTVKSYRAAIVICSGIEPKTEREIDVEMLKDVSGFAITFEEIEVEQRSCKYCIRSFQDMIPVEINLNGEWRFDVTEHLDRIRRFFPDLILGNREKV